MIRKDGPWAGVLGSPEDLVGEESEGADRTGLERRTEGKSQGNRQPQQVVYRRAVGSDLIFRIIARVSSVQKGLVDGDFPSGPVVKTPPSNARDRGSIPGQETKIPRATGQLLSPQHNNRAHAGQQRPNPTQPNK